MAHDLLRECFVPLKARGLFRWPEHLSMWRGELGGKSLRERSLWTNHNKIHAFSIAPLSKAKHIAARWLWADLSDFENPRVRACFNPQLSQSRALLHLPRERVLSPTCAEEKDIDFFGEAERLTHGQWDPLECGGETGGKCTGARIAIHCRCLCLRESAQSFYSDFEVFCSMLLNLRSAASVTALVTLVVAATAPAMETDVAAVLAKLNEPYARVADAGKSAPKLLVAFLDVTPSPQPVGADFNLTTIYPGMDGWDETAKWAVANQAFLKVLQDVQSAQVLGVPYGTEGVDPRFIEHGLTALIGTDGDLRKISFPYLDALRTMSALVVADMYRQCEAGDFDAAFVVGVAHLRVLRQACDCAMYKEKVVAMTLLADSLSVHRDVLWTYYAKLPGELTRKLATKEYSYLKPSDNERLKRLEMPEGDRIVAESLIAEVFDASGQPDQEKFAAVFSQIQSAEEPLTQFGSTKRWQSIAGVHGSLDASEAKLKGIYDNWWRRWRLRQYDPIMAVPTEMSRLNTVRYAAVVLAVKDIESLFALRRRLVTEQNGTVLAAGLCAYRSQFGDWPNDIEKAYAVYIPKRFDFDPYDVKYGHLIYRALPTAKAVDSEFGREEVKGCILFARNDDHEPSGYSKHAAGGATDDFVLWPALRALSREGGTGQ